MGTGESLVIPGALTMEVFLWQFKEDRETWRAQHACTSGPWCVGIGSPATGTWTPDSRGISRPAPQPRPGRRTVPRVSASWQRRAIPTATASSRVPARVAPPPCELSSGERVARQLGLTATSSGHIREGLSRPACPMCRRPVERFDCDGSSANPRWASVEMSRGQAYHHAAGREPRYKGACSAGRAFC
jgi:hypothetical protein